MQVFTLIKVGVEKHNLSDSSPKIFTKTLQNNDNSMPNTQSSNRKQILWFVPKIYLKSSKYAKRSKFKSL